jgi:hypothetical protein
MQDQLNAFLRKHSVLPTSDREVNLRAALDIIRKAKTFQTTPYKAWTAELKRCTRRKTNHDSQLPTDKPTITPTNTSRKPGEKQTKSDINTKQQTNKELAKKPDEEPTNEPTKEPAKEPTKEAPTTSHDTSTKSLAELKDAEPSVDDHDYVVCDAEPSSNCTIL